MISGSKIFTNKAILANGRSDTHEKSNGRSNTHEKSKKLQKNLTYIGILHPHIFYILPAAVFRWLGIVLG